MGYKFWRTKDGELVKISDMSDSHLLNTIQMIETLAEINMIEDWGPMYDHPSEVFPEYDDLVLEKEYRKL